MYKIRKKGYDPKKDPDLPGSNKADKGFQSDPEKICYDRLSGQFC